MSQQQSFKQNVAVIDLFCGVGGITHGFHLEGFNVVAGLDVDADCRFAYEHNNPGSKFIEANLADYEPEKIAALYPPDTDIRILVGCAPCQPFSTNNSKRSKQTNDDKWKLVTKFSEIIQEIQPEIISMENVPNLKSFDDGRVLGDFLHILEELGYSVYWGVVKASKYDVPQSRKRLIVLASKLGDISMIPSFSESTTPRTVRDVIGSLEPIVAGVSSETDPLHTSRGMDEINLLRIRASVPGGTWEIWDDDLKANCHKKQSGSSYKSVYGRMEWDKIAPTITGQFYAYGSGRFGHPEQDRAISLREGALLQTFPENYRFVQSEKDITFNKVGIHIGNAVPVNLARAIAKSISIHLEDK